MKTALIVIATGGPGIPDPARPWLHHQGYWQYITPLIESAKRFFVDHDVCLFTDCPDPYPVARQLTMKNEGFPGSTLHRYRTILTQREWLEQYDQMFYVDVDMLFVHKVTDEIFSDGITAVRHPGRPIGDGSNSHPTELENNPYSTAYTTSVKTYYCGGFNGGSVKAFLKMAEKLDTNIAKDEVNQITACCNDESHLNRYLEDNPPAKVLDQGFCYPEVGIEIFRRHWKNDFTPHLIALTKSVPDSPWRQFYRNGKTLIAVVTCKAYKDRVAAQKQTWIPTVEALGYDVQIFDGERLGVGDDYYSLPAKTKALCQWAEKQSYERLLKIDDDGYIRSIAFSPVLYDYAGISNGPNDYGSPVAPGRPAMPRGTYPHKYCSGGAYWLSRKAFELVASAPLTSDWAEDRWVGHVLASQSIFLSVLGGYLWTDSRSHGGFRNDGIVLTQLSQPNEIIAAHNYYNLLANPPQPVVSPAPRVGPRQVGRIQWAGDSFYKENEPIDKSKCEYRLIEVLIQGRPTKIWDWVVKE